MYIEQYVYLVTYKSNVYRQTLAILCQRVSEVSLLFLTSFLQDKLMALQKDL